MEKEEGNWGVVVGRLGYRQELAGEVGGNWVAVELGQGDK